MKHQKVIYEGLTFDDVLLQPRKSSVLPSQVDIRTKLTREISISIPFISAAMDTVTESNMAIALAREGGLGIIHKNMSIETQAEEIDRVKRSESGMIRDPVTVNPDQPIFDALELMKKYKISGIPVIDSTNTFVGILTNRDLRFSPNPKLKIKELMTKERLITAPVGTDFATAEKLLQQYKIEKLPVVDKNGKLKGLITYKDILKKKQHPFASKDNLGRLQVGGAVGVTGDTFDRVEALIAASVDVVVIDTAHGQSKGVLNLVKDFKKKFKDTQLIVGNIATSSAALELYSLGVDAVKVGIGPGSICTTRVVTGVGVPQISAIMDVANALKGKNLPIIADGGIKYTGDSVKALAAGADTVMIGSLFAGVEESPGEKILLEGRSFKSYRGMGSLGAMQFGSKERYFQDMEDDIKKLVPEGVEGRVPYKGQLSDTILQFVGGLRAAMGYCGVKNIKELKEKTHFIKMTSAGFRESHAHDVIITKESPNYHR
ncbi:MAG: IMP dehydrogenase [Ignavibacteria bacterium CG22_combo_CG10-13_8_21_14_all_37_15]|nr:IMP dehydrogenase [Ignavibacteria bacterium]OIO23124.1 MAG: IMP dehydrogenase [Ignavibacteria bacterium CG1_02_37_35]PIP77700.1 MAG: IMP dehydrogenase [Ignavibacteria bacterium CG22_combo_CG10-13_8_21_14_all_37_15]PIS45911.1 MAG: IMP dehydrogenase [Ignavibacteria bacterium CG08_land_8_20_14_0_20_37_9]PIX93460.1 MAG: IMP dehydrogenase [Ignavibacteria bacterium CG_4_10_14_3_um_filter_37_18]PJC59632.1 MAG: IMP dehydrogenase [Ignavibacteria bacterium CG_4_9_14_0_2_um_filter_37_13]